MRSILRVSRYLLIKRLCKSRAYPKRKPSVLCAMRVRAILTLNVCVFYEFLCIVDCDYQEYRQFMLAFMMRFIA